MLGGPAGRDEQVRMWGQGALGSSLEASHVAVWLVQVGNEATAGRAGGERGRNQVCPLRDEVQ